MLNEGKKIRMNYEEKTLTSEKVFEGKIIDLRIETVELPDGKTAYRELVDHPGGVGVLAVLPDGRIPLVRQYRKPIEDYTWEIPAGKLDKGEEPIVCGKRELEEETGYKVEELISLGYIYPSPGFVNEVTHMFFAKDLSQGEVHPDEDEFLDVKSFTVDEVRNMILSNEINDAKTVAAFLKCEAMKLF